ncbi:hypothetical protein KAR91_22165 [Candidatus Pacearchaeota archaeon]|nr:hypothetical protein [Candidatus Pacearchaeota archaeon]
MSKSENISFNETSKKVIGTSLDPVEIKFSCTVSGTKQSDKADGGLKLGTSVENVRVKLIFTGTTLYEALKFASGGQSFRVAIQARLRMTAKKDLLEKEQVFYMSEVFNPKKRGFVWIPPSQKKLTILKDMFEAGDIDEDLFDISKARFEKQIDEEKAANAAEKV